MQLFWKLLIRIRLSGRACKTAIKRLEDATERSAPSSDMMVDGINGVMDWPPLIKQLEEVMVQGRNIQ